MREAINLLVASTQEARTESVLEFASLEMTKKKMFIKQLKSTPLMHKCIQAVVKRALMRIRTRWNTQSRVSWAIAKVSYDLPLNVYKEE